MAGFTTTASVGVWRLLSLIIKHLDLFGFLALEVFFVFGAPVTKLASRIAIIFVWGQTILGIRIACRQTILILAIIIVARRCSQFMCRHLVREFISSAVISKKRRGRQLQGRPVVVVVLGSINRASTAVACVVWPHASIGLSVSS